MGIERSLRQVLDRYPTSMGLSADVTPGRQSQGINRRRESEAILSNCRTSCLWGPQNVPRRHGSGAFHDNGVGDRIESPENQYQSIPLVRKSDFRRGIAGQVRRRIHCLGSRTIKGQYMTMLQSVSGSLVQGQDRIRPTFARPECSVKRNDLRFYRGLGSMGKILVDRRFARRNQSVARPDFLLCRHNLQSPGLAAACHPASAKKNCLKAQRSTGVGVYQGATRPEDLPIHFFGIASTRYVRNTAWTNVDPAFFGGNNSRRLVQPILDRKSTRLNSSH